MVNEKRLIDVTPLIDECVECMGIEWNKSVYTTWAEAEEDFRDRLLDAPTVDAVEVVRCKDCKWYRRDECIMPQSGSCDFHEMVKMDWDFCSRAKMDGDGNEKI